MSHTMTSRKRAFSDINSEQNTYNDGLGHVAPGFTNMGSLDGFSLMDDPNQMAANQYAQQQQLIPYMQQLSYGLPQAGFPGTFGEIPQQQQQPPAGHQQGQPVEIQDDYGADEGYPEDLDKRVADAKAKKKNKLPPFVEKVSTFVNDPNNTDIIRWSEDGSSFIVLDEDRFSKDLIPGVFKHNNFASFVRQLNMYNFHKKVGMSDGSLKAAMDGQKARLEYEHKYFKRGRPDLLFLIEKPKAGRKSKNPSGKKSDNIKEDSDDDIVSDEDHYENERGAGTGPRLIEDAPSVQNNNQQEYYPPQNGNQNGQYNVSNLNKSGPTTFPTLMTVVDHIVGQIQDIKSRQDALSNAFNRLQSNYKQLSEQATAFAEQHDRHEMSINNILSFLASVYNKNIDGGAPNGILQQNAFGIHGFANKHATPEMPNARPNKRTRYLLENGQPSGPNRKANGVPPFPTANTYSARVQDMGRLQELDTPTDTESPALRHASVTPVSTPTRPMMGGSNALIRSNSGALAVNNQSLMVSPTPPPPAPSEEELRTLQMQQANIEQNIRNLQQNVESLQEVGNLPEFDPQEFGYDSTDFESMLAAMSPGSVEKFHSALEEIEYSIRPTQHDYLGGATEDGSNVGTPDLSTRVEEVDENGQSPQN